jgi:hypothetical protein
VLAIVFGGAVLAMGYVSHGLRAATNQLGLAIVTPDGDRAFAEEYVGVYGTTSAEYRLGFPKNLPVRPLSEYVASPNGTGFENPSSFKLAAREERSWLDDWRLTFWQTRGTASVDCVQLGGRLTAVSNGASLEISNQTAIDFEEVILIAGAHRSLGRLKPYETKQLEVSSLADSPLDPSNRELDTIQSHRSSKNIAVAGNQSGTASEGSTPGHEPNELTSAPAVTDWPEAQSLLQTTAARLSQHNRDWVFGITRQPIHSVESPNTKRHLIASLYAWPVVRQTKTNPDAN